MFDYPQHAHQRRHGPRGYNDYRSFKPWLRDEFAFRCVYCLWRETWSSAGDAAFSVEHLQSQSRQPDLARDYANLVYACCGCNSAKQDHDSPLNPCRDRVAEHVSVSPDGAVIAKSAEGQALIDLCLLNRPALVSARQTMFRLWTLLNAESSAEARELKHRLFGHPSDLPNLAKLHPPDGNAIPSGLSASFFERRRRGELPALFDGLEPAR